MRAIADEDAVRIETMNAWHSLLANLAIVAISVSIWTQLSEAVGPTQRSLRTALLAMLFSAGTIAVSATQIEIRPGVFVDLRATMVVLSAFYGGPVVGIIVFVCAVVYSAWMGGVTASAAIIGIAVAGAIGGANHLALRGRAPNHKDALIVAAIASGGSVAGFLFLPPAIRATLFPDVAAAVATLTFLSMAGAGLAIVSDLRRRQTERENRLYAAIIDALPEPLHAKDLAHRFLAANPASAALMQVKDAAQLIGHTDFDFYPPETAALFERDEDRLIEEGKPVTLRQPVTFKDGSAGWLTTLKAPIRDASGALIGFITHNRDITERVRLEEGYAESQRRLAQALATMPDGLAMFDRDALILMCNPQYAALFPATASLRVAGANLHDILHAAIACGEETVPTGVDTEAWIEATCAGLSVSANTEIRLGDGRWLEARVRPSDNGTSFTVVSEITAAKRAEAALQEVNARLDALARTDGLTGLPNRRAFDEALTFEFARNARVGGPISLFFADVDWFKAYNDTYGHPQGDECLKAVGSALRQVLKRTSDVAARYGGEEFVVLLPETDATGAFTLAEAFRQSVRDLKIPHSGSEKSYVTVTVGVATSVRKAIGSRALLIQRADEALYSGKATGRDCTHQAPPETDDHRLLLVAG
jgi:diguanylate cyclase (GGDEF)-like protein/PAS domain S-box-containing protein